MWPREQRLVRSLEREAEQASAQSPEDKKAEQFFYAAFYLRHPQVRVTDEASKPLQRNHNRGRLEYRKAALVKTKIFNSVIGKVALALQRRRVSQSN